MTPRVVIGLGSNVESERNLKAAAELLRKRWPDTRFSSVYRTAPRDISDQPAFLNAVAVIETADAPEVIHDSLIQIERTLKKSLPYRFGPRTIDLDILLADNEVIDQPGLTVPHPRMHERRFVLEPLCELMDPKQTHPVLNTSWGELLNETRSQESEKVRFEW